VVNILMMLMMTTTMIMMLLLMMTSTMMIMMTTTTMMIMLLLLMMMKLSLLIELVSMPTCFICIDIDTKASIPLYAPVLPYQQLFILFEFKYGV